MTIKLLLHCTVSQNIIAFILLYNHFHIITTKALLIMTFVTYYFPRFTIKILLIKQKTQKIVNYNERPMQLSLVE
jgi:hypothetical protein